MLSGMTKEQSIGGRGLRRVSRSEKGEEREEREDGDKTAEGME